jgi:glycosyltransferase involved in cell wall biosynthesis
VTDGETGWLVDRDPDAVAERVARVLGDPVRARAMGLAGRRRILAEFTSDHRAARVEQVYARLMQEGG